MHLFALAFSPLAFAEEPPAALPVYTSVRAGMAVPATAHGDVLTGGLGLGVELEPENTLGLRVIYMHAPPENPLAVNTPDVPWAWGPVIDWRHFFGRTSSINFYTSVSIGYVYGVPENEHADNVVLPIVEGGFGARLSRTTSSGARIFISPELGVVPAALAPYSAVTVGVIGPRRSG